MIKERQDKKAIRAVERAIKAQNRTIVSQRDEEVFYGYPMDGGVQDLPKYVNESGIVLKNVKKGPKIKKFRKKAKNGSMGFIDFIGDYKLDQISSLPKLSVENKIPGSGKAKKTDLGFLGSALGSVQFLGQSLIQSGKKPFLDVIDIKKLIRRDQKLQKVSRNSKSENQHRSTRTASLTGNNKIMSRKSSIVSNPSHLLIDTTYKPFREGVTKKVAKPRKSQPWTYKAASQRVLENSDKIGVCSTASPIPRIFQKSRNKKNVIFSRSQGRSKIYILGQQGDASPGEKVDFRGGGPQKGNLGRNGVMDKSRQKTSKEMYRVVRMLKNQGQGGDNDRKGAQKSPVNDFGWFFCSENFRQNGNKKAINLGSVRAKRLTKSLRCHPSEKKQQKMVKRVKNINKINIVLDQEISVHKASETSEHPLKSSESSQRPSESSSNSSNGSKMVQTYFKKFGKFYKKEGSKSDNSISNERSYYLGSQESAQGQDLTKIANWQKISNKLKNIVSHRRSRSMVLDDAPENTTAKQMLPKNAVFQKMSKIRKKPKSKQKKRILDANETKHNKNQLCLQKQYRMAVKKLNIPKKGKSKKSQLARSFKPKTRKNKHERNSDTFIRVLGPSPTMSSLYKKPKKVKVWNHPIHWKNRLGSHKRPVFDGLGLIHQLQMRKKRKIRDKGSKRRLESWQRGGGHGAAQGLEIGMEDSEEAVINR